MQGFPSRLLALCENCPRAMLNREYWSIKDFALVKEVGSGAASTVYYALCRKSTKPVAIKMYNKSKLSKLNRRQVEREINIHSSLSHPHIIDFYAAFEDDERIYLVQEYAAGGDLFDDVKRRGGRLPEREVVQQVLYPYLTALAYLHARGIIHRDIKPENTVFTRERVMKVTDFGLAINATTERPVTRLGTLDYMAPEVLRCPDKHAPEDNKDRVDLEYDTSVDAWAMGVLAYELVVGRPPFGMSCREATMRAIVSAAPSLPDWMSPAAADFIRTALQRTPGRRSPVAQLLEHPWIVGHMRSLQPQHTPRGLFCGAQASAASVYTSSVAAATSTTTTSAITAAVGFASSGGAPCGPASAASARSLYYHPGGLDTHPHPHYNHPHHRQHYQHQHHLLVPSQNNACSVSNSDLGVMAVASGGGTASAASMYGNVAAAAAAVVEAAAASAMVGTVYNSDQRPAKRQVQRCQSAQLGGGDVGVGSSSSTLAAMDGGGLAAGMHQGHTAAAAAASGHRPYDAMSYWVTDGNGFCRDPFVGLGGGGGGGFGANAGDSASRTHEPYAPAGAAAAADVAGAAGGSVAREFYQSQLARAGSSCLATQQQQHLLDQRISLVQQQDQQQQRVLQQQQQLASQQRSDQQYLVQEQQNLQFQQRYYREQQQQQQAQQQQVQQQQQQHAYQVSQQRLQQQQQQRNMQEAPLATAASTAAVQAPSPNAHLSQMPPCSLSVSGESGGGSANGVEPSVPPLTAADYYRLHLEDVRSMWDSGSRGEPGPASARSPINRGLSRSFAARPTGHRSGSVTGGNGSNDSHTDMAGAAVGANPAYVDTRGSPLKSARLLYRTGSGGAMKRRTPDTRDWDMPAPPGMPLMSHQLQYTSPQKQPSPSGQLAGPVQLTEHGLVASGSAAAATLVAHSSDAFVSPGGAAAFYTGSLAGLAGGVTAQQLAAAAPQPSSPAAMLEGCLGAGGLAAAAAAMTPSTSLAWQLSGSLSFTARGSHGARPSRLSRAFRRVESMEHRDHGRGSDDCPGSSAAVGGGAGCSLPLPAMACNSAASAAMAAMDQLSLAPTAVSGDNRGGGGGVAAAATAAPTDASATQPAGTSMGATTAGGTFSSSMCSYGFSAGSGASTVTAAPSAGASVGGSGGCTVYRAPSVTTTGTSYTTANAAAQSMTALGLLLPTILTSASGLTHAACSSSGGVGGAGELRSHPISSPLMTPWATPVNSPAASRGGAGGGALFRATSQSPAFDALLEYMQAEGMLTSSDEAGAAAAGATTTAASAAGGPLPGLRLAPGSSRDAGGGMEGAFWGPAQSGGGSARAAAAIPCDWPTPMNVDGGSGIGAHAAVAVPMGQQPTTPKDGWAAAWAAAMASGGNASSGYPRATTTSPTQATTSSPFARSFSIPTHGGSGGATGAAGGGMGPSMHMPSPLGRDQPQQQARAAAVQQLLRSRSLNRFQLEQMGLGTAGAGTGVCGPQGPMAPAAVAGLSLCCASPTGAVAASGGFAGTAPFGVNAGVAGTAGTAMDGDTRATGGVPDASTAATASWSQQSEMCVATEGGGGGEGCSSVGFGNRHGPQAFAISAGATPLRGLSYAQHPYHSSQPHHQPNMGPPSASQRYPGAVGDGHMGMGMSSNAGCFHTPGSTLPSVPSPLGLRCSSGSQPSSSSEEMTGTPQGKGTASGS
ncbi:hypothetical protein Agub_g11855 [Astrephomene gubernaculifera]|uniref:Protein kinase domain-containing protein n=1 Tax=Astrephomene gubernaculifera TaxID=47775 RepID=A0AAD3DZ48_9CHLO|nr:hypothetical protein Agub_g11855 [Astrephomene gubernaculifera]